MSADGLLAGNCERQDALDQEAFDELAAIHKVARSSQFEPQLSSMAPLIISRRVV